MKKAFFGMLVSASMASANYFPISFAGVGTLGLAHSYFGEKTATEGKIFEIGASFDGYKEVGDNGSTAMRERGVGVLLANDFYYPNAYQSSLRAEFVPTVYDGHDLTGNPLRQPIFVGILTNDFERQMEISEGVNTLLGVGLRSKIETVGPYSSTFRNTAYVKAGLESDNALGKASIYGKFGERFSETKGIDIASQNARAIGLDVSIPSDNFHKAIPGVRFRAERWFYSRSADVDGKNPNGTGTIKWYEPRSDETTVSLTFNYLY